MRWIMITRKLDPADDRAGFVMRWIETLAARLDHLDVICQETAHPTLPDNVSAYSMGKESGAGRPTQVRNLVKHLRARVPESDGVLCHMIPRYVWLSAPWTRLHHKPLFLWYTHRQITAELRLAHRLATHILTASPGSFPLPSGKLNVVGHGIDTALFPPAEGESAPPELVLVARLSHIKRQDWLLRAASGVMARGDSRPFRVRIVGGPVEKEPGYLAELQALAGSLTPRPDVDFTGPLPHAQAAEIVRNCAVALNLSPPGLFDKTALEAMLTGKPTLVTNPDFLPLLGDAADVLYLPPDADESVLVDRLAHLLALSPDERAALGRDLRERARAAHSLDGLMDRIAALMREAASHA
ncbi:MAG: glycosyltransferase family 4 protein [Anaerolineae bacterium]|nr:glycosyltransferase family 4 protein [Anaerolineae bacterium]